MENEKKTKEPRQPASLYPLPFEEAVADLLQVKPGKKKKSEARKRKKPAGR